MGSMDEMIQCRVGGWNISMVIDSGHGSSKPKRLGNASKQCGSIAKRKNQFKAYATNQLLKILFVFEAAISVEKGTEIIATFYVIENAKQSLLGSDTVIEHKVLKLGLSTDCVNSIERVEPFPKTKDVTVNIAIASIVKL